MALFQQSVLRKYSSELPQSELAAKWQLFKTLFHDPVKQQNIRAAKEEQYQEGFLRELFVQVLDYTLNPQPQYNLTTEYKNEKDSRKADGAVLHEGKVVAVIELKGTDTTDLGKVENQAFGYKHNQKDCTYVITSNFEKLRFYVQDAVDYEEFDLFTLTEERFALLWLCLHKNSLLGGTPHSMKQQSLTQEDAITKKLYADYSHFKRKLFDSLRTLNPAIDQLLLFKKTQKLLDRFLFILFAEDRLLLPPNFIIKIVEEWKQVQKLRLEQSLYQRFKLYFNDLHTGNKEEDIFAYNGGLFEPDDLLDGLHMDDSILMEGVLSLSRYDYNTEVDVNILGHIFEHSLNEIEELQAQLQGTYVDKGSTKRKKDGVFYTPRYITKYIVDNTVGSLCAEKKNELQIVEEEYAPNKKKSNKKELLDKLDAYREWLRELTICDPACGSGAFLNAALEFLIAEHRYIDELNAKLLGHSLILAEAANEILENNLYGVDINEEAVEIARLSLWLRTAQKGRKLSKLSGNVKCGNSLIENKEVAGEDAFNWENEYSNVFRKGGFDIIIGNPPYGALLTESEKEFFGRHFKVFNGNQDIYTCFYQKAIEIVSENGKIGYITPVSWQNNERYFALRSFFKENVQIVSAIKLPYDVFEDAYVDTGIYTLTRRKTEKYNSLVYEFPVRFKGLSDLQYSITFKSLSNEQWETSTNLSFVTSDVFYDLNAKVHVQTIKLGEISKSIRGILAKEEDIYNQKEEHLKPYFVGDIYRYENRCSLRWVVYGDNLKEKPNDYSWFQGERLLIRRLISRKFRIMATFAEEEFVNKKDLYVLKSNDAKYNNKFLLALINSSLFSYIKTKGSTNATKDDFSQLTLGDIRALPIKITTSDEQSAYIEKVDQILHTTESLRKLKQDFLQLLTGKFIQLSISKKLLEWPSLLFSEFLKELEKSKIKLSLFEQKELMIYFDEEKRRASLLHTEIDQVDNEIDTMVYNLYGLTKEEVTMVESTD